MMTIQNFEKRPIAPSTIKDEKLREWDMISDRSKTKEQLKSQRQANEMDSRRMHYFIRDRILNEARSL